MHHYLLILLLSAAVQLRSQTLNYYFGNLHAHSSYSDGNKDAGTSGCSTPADDYAYAKLSLNFDFLGISEHNHYSNGSVGMQLSNYAPGLSQAAAATTSTFLALYGVEWGVSSASYSGHVIIYGFNQLIGWETGNYDIYNDKLDYDGLFKKVKNNPGAFCYLAHPYWTDFSNLSNVSYSPAYDSAIVGVPFRSGIYNSTVTNYTHYPSGDYFDYYIKMLSKGYHLGMTYDHDNHNTTFGRSTAGRLVVIAPSLTSANFYNAMQKMHFYGSDDWNAKIDFKIGSSIMGDTVSGAAPAINVVHNDVDGELADSIKIWMGVPGSGSLPTVLAVSKSLNTLSYTDLGLTAGTRYYFAEIIQADGQKIVTSPIWYTYNGAIGINELNTERDFVMFPNPAVTELNLSTGLNEPYTVDIIDLAGRTVFSEAYSTPDLRIPVQEIAKGFYTVKISSATFSRNKPLVIE